MRTPFRTPFIVGLLLLAASATGPVTPVAGLPAPATGTLGEDGPATEAALNNAEDVAVAPNGDIYLADRNSSRLVRIRDDILTVAYRGDFASGENDFSAVTVAADGTVYFTNGLAVMSLDSDGHVEEVIALPQPGQANGPKLAAAPDDLIVAQGRIPRLDRIEADGTTTVLAGADDAATEPGAGDGGPAAEAGFGSISDVEVDSKGVIYVADEAFGDIRRITTDGVVSTIFGAGSVPTGQAIDGTPAADVENGAGEIGIALDADDRLYVVPRLAGKVYRMEGGHITAVAGGGLNPGSGSDPLDTHLQAPFRITFAGDDLLMLVEDGRFLLLVPRVAATGALVDSVPSPNQINLDPIVVAASVALTAGMLFLIPLPAEIFNNTLVEHHDQIRSWFRRRSDPGGSGIWAKPWIVALGIVAMALMYGFLDPGFGLAPSSLPTFVGLLIGVVITTLGFMLPSMIMRRVRKGEMGRARVLPMALLIGVGCVLLSRLIGFRPGYLYGIALGALFAADADEGTEVAEVLVTSFVVAGIAFAGWFGLGMVRASEPGALAVIGEAATAMTTVAAFEALVFGLLPVHGMPGLVLFRRLRWVWVVVWGISVLYFFHVLINPQSGYLVDTALVPTAVTYGLLVFFTLLSLTLWLWFRRADQRAELGADHRDPPDTSVRDGERGWG